MIGVTKSLPLQLHRSIGQRLRARREELGLKRSVVARHLGYKNLSSGSGRLSAWERGEMGPLLDEDKLFELLDLDAAPIQAELLRATQIHNRIQVLGYPSLAAERKLLRTNALRLLKRAGRIERDPKLSGIRTPAARLSLLYLGGGPLALGKLVGAWDAGSLIAQTDEYGPVYLFEGSGSPFSGAGKCSGVDRTGATRYIERSPSRFFDRNGPNLWNRRLEPSPWSLADAVAALGGRAPRSKFFLLDGNAEPVGAPIATYDPKRRKLVVSSGLALDPAQLTPTALKERISSRGLSVGGGPPRPVAVGGLTLGAHGTAQVVHPCGLRTGHGRIEGEGGWFPLFVDGPCPPPAVLPLLAGLLDRIQDKEEPFVK